MLRSRLPGEFRSKRMAAMKGIWFETLRLLTAQKKELRRREEKYSSEKEQKLKSESWLQWGKTFAYQQDLNARATLLRKLTKQKFMTLWVSVLNNHQSSLA